MKIFAFLFLLVPVLLLAEKTPDHPLVKRVRGSEVFFQKKADFEQLKLALESVQWSGAEMKVKPFKSITVEGQLTTTYYRIPEGIGTLETLRNYEQELKESGFEILFSGRGEEVETVGYNSQIAREVLNMKGIYGNAEEKAQWPFQHTDEAQAAYIAARKSGENGEFYVSVYIVRNSHNNWLQMPEGVTLARVDVCEIKPREQRMELVTSAQMNDSISLNGRVALYGIQFDFNSAAIKPDSEPTLSEIAVLLKEKPELKLLVVGHTDTIGSFSFNKELSQKRAEAVTRALANKGIDPTRLFPVGVGFAAPVASNSTEEGRSKNRRVELVDLAGGKFD